MFGAGNALAAAARAAHLAGGRGVAQLDPAWQQSWAIVLRAWP